MDTDRRAEVWAKTGGRCWYCGTQTSPWKDFHVEHSIPRSKGGTDDLANLVPSCQPCNNRKRDKNIEEFRAYLQGKAEHTFWFEHARLPMAIVTSEPEVGEEDDEEEERPYPNFFALRHYIRSCLQVIHRGQAFVLTMMTLLLEADDWTYDEDEIGAVACRGGFTIEWLATMTGQSRTALLSHLLILDDVKLLSITLYDNGLHTYELFIGAYICQCVEKRRRDRARENEMTA